MANWSNNAKSILAARYLKKDKQGNVVETPDQMLERVAIAVAMAEKEENRSEWSERFLSIMDSLDFLPNSPALINAGRELGQLQACLSGDTIIRTCAGNITIKELAKKYRNKSSEEFDVYCIVSSPVELLIGKAFNPRLTKENAPVFKVLFEDGSSIRATENHQIKCYDGKFVEVKNLNEDNQAMSFDIDTKRGYAMLLPKKVVSIEFSGYEDVYDLSVKKHHNFVANNTFVHNCFVLPIADDIEQIFEMVKTSAIIHRSGGGTGYNFSSIRPAGSLVGSTQGVASGPCSFLRAFDVVTDIIKQGGVRRGANLGCLNVSHPDIMDFIHLKQDTTHFQNFNFSVAMTGNFLEKVKSDKNIQLHFHGFPYKETIPARKIFDEICIGAWNSGEPGILFLDTINRANPLPEFGKIWATNPCGENPQFAFEACNLGSINLSNFVEKRDIAWKKLKETIEVAVRMLDDMIDINKYPRIQIQRKTQLLRRVGLGIMGWADVLGKMGIEYDSSEALELATKVMKYLSEVSLRTSYELGKEKGVNFKKLRRRNIALTTIAPTGTLSILADCSASIEPHFASSYEKMVLNGVKLNFGNDYKIRTAMQILPVDHVKMQAAFQTYTGNAVSKTINLPTEATLDQVKEAILFAYSLSCKGLTLYRQGSRDAPQKVKEGLSECQDDRCLI